MENVKKQELNSMYGVMAKKYIDTDLNSIYPNNDFVVSLDTICDKLTGKIHTTITYYLSLLDEAVEFSKKYAIQSQNKIDGCFYHIAADVHSNYETALDTIFEVSNLLIPLCMRYGKSYENFMHELTKYKKIGCKMFDAIYTVDGYKKFALDVRKGLIQ